MSAPLSPTRRRGAVLIAALLFANCSTPAPPPAVVEPVATPDSQNAASAKSGVSALPNGLGAFVKVAAANDDTQVQLAVLGGAQFVAPGLAELAAAVLLASSDPKTGRRSLQQEIAMMGGTIAVRIGLATTWFDMRVPRDETARCLTALRRALESITTSRNQIERMRRELVAARTATIVGDPIAAMAQALLLGYQSTADQISALLDLDPSQVSQFHSLLYRPERCLLVLSAPRPIGIMVNMLREPASDAIGRWQPPPASPGSNELLRRNFESGLYWAEAGQASGENRVAFVLRLPDPTQRDAAEWLMMHACLTLGGTGGRLERLQDEAGLGHLQWRTSLAQTPDALALVMQTRATSEEAIELWRMLQSARNSLLDVPPSPSELQLARRRARLDAGLATLDDSTRLQWLAGTATTGVSVDSIQRRLDAMVEPGSWNVTQAAKAYLEQPAWMIAIGGARPEQLAGLRGIDLLPTGVGPSRPSATGTDNAMSVDTWLDRARQAVGGRQTIASITGFAAAASVAVEKAPAITEETTFRAAGTLRRTRIVLGATIETELDGNNGREQLGDITRSLDAREVMLLRHEMQRHPLMLLAAHSRGDLRLRSVGQRQSGDREFVVFEAVDSDFDRLRLHIDSESCLVRVVESWERMADDTIVYVREAWSDYRPAGPLRAPYLRRTTWNDGERHSETNFSSWSPTFAAR